MSEQRTDDWLRERCEEWQARLSLRDWRINVRFADSGELNSNEGSCRVFRDDKLAIVRVSRAEAFDETDDYHKAFPDTYDAERILVHELLHIPFDGIFNIEAEGHESVAQEQALNAVTNALCKAYERGRDA